MSKSKTKSVEQYIYRVDYINSETIAYLVRVKRLDGSGKDRRKTCTTLEAAKAYKKAFLELRAADRVATPKTEKVSSYTDKPGVKGWGGMRAIT